MEKPPEPENYIDSMQSILDQNPKQVKSIVFNVQPKSLTRQVEEFLWTKPDLMRYSQKVVSLMQRQHQEPTLNEFISAKQSKFKRPKKERL